MSQGLAAVAAEIVAFSDRDVSPLICDRSVALHAEVFQTRDPVVFGDALAASYRPVAVGWRWGPVWSNAWFRLRGVVPREMAGRRVHLRFSSGTEALYWDRGVPMHGLDLNHEFAAVLVAARGGEELTLHVEAACNRPLGATTFFWDDAAEVARWKEPLPGRFEQAELVTIDEGVRKLRHGLVFAARVLKLMDAADPRAQELGEGLLGVVGDLRAGGIAETADRAFETVRKLLGRGDDSQATRCHAVGHAHIDTAWLWTLRETRRKCLRTFSTALELLERFPEFRFLCSQAQQYAWVEQDSPGLFAKIRERVMEGRWEPGGAMWIEPDCNIPSGESLIRQILHGTRYWRERFGVKGEQVHLYLPDTFGFPASLPQIIEQAGLGVFITNKLGWNETNEFPHSTFLWRGIDGTEVLSHCTPGMEYNSTLTPAELKKGEVNHVRKDEVRTSVWLQPFGFGDGGGGPTDWMVLEAELARDCVAMPRVECSDARSFCEQLRLRATELQKRGGSLPVWDGELYLERHRGTYTTQAWIKKANRLAEEKLRMAEWLACAGPRSPGGEGLRQIAAELDEAWKLTLLNQFHDILPGSSIGEVYAEARGRYARVDAVASAVIARAGAGWAGSGGGTLIANPCSTARSGIVEIEGLPRWVDAVPAMGVRVLGDSAPTHPVSVSGSTLRNGLVAATISQTGEVTSLRRLAHGGGPDVVAAGSGLNRLVLYDDNPKYWEAWDIDEGYWDHAHPVPGSGATWSVVEEGPLRAVVEISQDLGEASRITQRFVLHAGSPRLDVQTTVSWNESRKLLRAVFPTGIRSREATCGIQFGHIRRPTHTDTSWDRAKFEVCAHRWIDLSEPGCGLAVLNDCKYGHSCRAGVLGLSLLRSTKFPDPEADMGEHEFTYSLMPHGGDWRAAGVDREAEALNRPFMVLRGGWNGGLSEAWAPFTLMPEGKGGGSIEIVAIKPSESGDRVIARLVETRGLGPTRISVDWHIRVGEVASVDVAERPRSSVMLSHDRTAQRTRFTIKPFEIVTLAVERM